MRKRIPRRRPTSSRPTSLHCPNRSGRSTAAAPPRARRVALTRSGRPGAARKQPRRRRRLTSSRRHSTRPLAPAVLLTCRLNAGRAHTRPLPRGIARARVLPRRHARVHGVAAGDVGAVAPAIGADMDVAGRSVGDDRVVGLAQGGERAGAVREHHVERAVRAVAERVLRDMAGAADARARPVRRDDFARAAFGLDLLERAREMRRRAARRMRLRLRGCGAVDAATTAARMASEILLVDPVNIGTPSTDLLWMRESAAMCWPRHVTTAGLESNHCWVGYDPRAAYVSVGHSSAQRAAIAAAARYNAAEKRRRRTVLGERHHAQDDRISARHACSTGRSPRPAPSRRRRRSRSRSRSAASGIPRSSSSRCSRASSSRKGSRSRSSTPRAAPRPCMPVVVRLDRHRHDQRHARRDRGLRQGHAGEDHLGGSDRRARRVLVCAAGERHQVDQGHQRQDGRVLLARLLDQSHPAAARQRRRRRRRSWWRPAARPAR